MTDNEINREIAEKVMGYKFLQSSPDPHKWFCKDYGNDQGWVQTPEFPDSWYCLKCYGLPNYATDISQAIGAAHAALLFWGIEIEIIGSATTSGGETLEAKWKVGASYPTINEQDQGFTGYNLVELGRLPAQMMLTILECLPAAIKAKEAALKVVES